MVIVKSSSGIRGTIGGLVGKCLSPIDVVKIISGYAYWIKNRSKLYRNKNIILLGIDGRSTSEMFHKLISSTIKSSGINILDIGLSTTPTIGFAILNENVLGGIMITASHNPKNWNGLKLFNYYGEFLSSIEIKSLFRIIKKKYFKFVSYKKLGKIFYKKDYINKHINKILSLPIIDKENIKKCKLKIVVDGINSTGGIAVPILLKKLGINVIKIHCNPDGNFKRNPEPIKKNLKEICKKVLSEKANLGISVDPDVDRVVFICENGAFFGEEYTLISIVDYILKNEKGPVVSTLSSSNILEYISLKNKVPFYTSPVGEVNVVKQMKKVNAIIGGEGNGGIIYPKLRYGRDALIGIALFLSYLSKLNCISLSNLKKLYPISFMSKKKIRLSFCYKKFIENIKKKYKKEKINVNDGIKINFMNNEWIHIRKSNTENIIRIYSESHISNNRANYLTNGIINDIKKII
ncbi:phosphoglucosamine mutase [Blattabacterium cuenoti]|uniref:phosphoglucosamine mutase n=1 Tax=Blattabacterium cuenoti TaxID=1653831 RepID=UPI00163C7545|nr:phosphoglucosamine mutase [Blattabacterium cuenoti]